MGPYQRTPKEVARAIGYAGLGVRSVGPVGYFLDHIYPKKNQVFLLQNCIPTSTPCDLFPQALGVPQPTQVRGETCSENMSKLGETGDVT